MTGPIELDGLSLRERKKVLTKRSILDAAKRLFEERGYDEVTVAEIADAANVSVKTLFVYFRSKEDLVFADNDLIDTLLARLTSREEHISPARVVADVLIEEVRGQPDGAAGLRAYHHAYGDSTALRSRLLRMWSEWEDRVTELLAGQAGAPANPITRLHAIALIGLVRITTTPELRTAIDPTDPRAIVTFQNWLRAAATAIETAHGSATTRTVQVAADLETNNRAPATLIEAGDLDDS